MIKKRKTTNNRSRQLIVRTANLPQDKRDLIQVPTPSEFIKERPGKGGRTFRYIEGGYVIARLNQIFSPIGWDFDIVSQQIEQTEVIVRGRLSIKDFKTGFSIGKTRTGTKGRIAGVPLGDTIKAAETDSLKKCASHFGIGLDVYWQQLDEDKLAKPTKAEKTVEQKPIDKAKKATVLMTNSLAKIQAETDPTILSQFYERIEKSSLYNDKQKKILFGAIATQRKRNLNKDNDKLF